MFNISSSINIMPRVHRRLLLAAGLVLLAGPLQAQQVIAPPPSAAVTPAALAPYTTQTPNVVAEALGIAENGAPLQWGIVDFRPRALYSFLYGTGLETAPGSQVKSIVQEVSPGINLAIGDHVTVDYSPTWTFYSNSGLTNSLDQAATIAWGTTYENWVLGLSQSYSTSSGSQIGTGTQTHEETLATAGNVSYRLGGARLDVGLYQTFTDIKDFTYTKEWSTMNWLNYQFLPEFTAAVGVGYGYVETSGIPDQTFEDYEGRLAYQVTKKIAVTVHGGVDDRQTPENLLNPVFGASIVYTPFETTSFDLDAERDVATAVFKGLDTETTSVTTSVTQRFLQLYYLTLGGGYSNTRYVLDGTNIELREDNTYSLNARVSTAFLKRGSIAATYSLTDNASDNAGFGFVSHQVGVVVSYRY